jgi:hypothetical protein
MFFCILKVSEDFGTDPLPDPDPLVRLRGTDTRTRIGTRLKGYQIIRLNTGINYGHSSCASVGTHIRICGKDLCIFCW